MIRIKHYSACALIAVLCIPNALQAAKNYFKDTDFEFEVEEPEHVRCSHSRWGCFVGAHADYVSLKRPDLPKFSGGAWGIIADVDYSPRERIHANLYFRSIWSELKSHDTIESDFSHYLLEGLLGYSVIKRESVDLTLYTGLTYGRMQSNQTELPTGLSYKYNILYLPLAFDLTWQMRSFFAASIQFAYRPDIAPTVSIKEVEGVLFKLEYDQSVELRIPLSFRINTCRTMLSFDIIPWAEWVTYGKARNTTCAPQPLLKIDALFTGVQFAIGLQF